MKQREELDWVGYVLRDVVAFLVKNDMMDSAKMLAVAAAFIENDMKGRTLPEVPAVRASDPKIVEFPVKRQRVF